MNEKRFVIDYATLGIFDNKTQKIYKINPVFEEEDLICFMNELADKNEQLLFQLNNISAQRDEFLQGAIENSEKIGRLEKENEKLQKRLRQIVENYNMTLKLDKEVYNKIRRLEKENMQLRQENEKLKKTEIIRWTGYE